MPTYRYESVHFPGHFIESQVPEGQEPPEFVKGVKIVGWDPPFQVVPCGPDDPKPVPLEHRKLVYEEINAARLVSREPVG